MENPQKTLDLPRFPQSFPHIVENSPFPHPFSTEKIQRVQICASVTKRMRLVFYGMQFDSHQIAKYVPAEIKKAAVLTHDGFLFCFT